MKKRNIIMMNRKKAQSLIEYGLILALVAVIALTVLGKFGASITKVGNNANDAVNSAGDNATNNYCDSVKAGSKFNTAKGKCE
jgi:Flp pilus assembly pilin Flp